MPLRHLHLHPFFTSNFPTTHHQLTKHFILTVTATVTPSSLCISAKLTLDFRTQPKFRRKLVDRDKQGNRIDASRAPPREPNPSLWLLIVISTPCNLLHSSVQRQVQNCLLCVCFELSVCACTCRTINYIHIHIRCFRFQF